MANHLPWTPWYWDDWDTDTAHLSLTEQGAYMSLLKHYYRSGRPLSANAEQLHRICRATGELEIKAVESVVAQFFALQRGEYHNKRADIELSKSSEISAKRSAAAKCKGRANAEQLQTQPHIHTHKEQKRGSTPSRYSQTDFDERDSRRLAEAKKAVSLRAQASIGAGGCFTEADFMTAVCEESGLLPKRVDELEKKTKWPAGASA